MSIFHLPDLGEGLSEAEIVEWHVAAGDAVAREQLLVSVETAKAIVDIPSPQAGTILRLYAKAGDIVPTGSPLVEFVSTEAETIEKPTPGKPADAGSVVGTLSHQAAEAAGSFVIGRHRHTEARLQQPTARRQQRQPAAKPPAASPEAFDGEVLHGLRRHMADAMAAAQREVALVTIHDEVEVHWENGKRPVLRLLEALAHACRKEPALNAWYDGSRKTRLLHEHASIALAIDTPAGLVAPVLREVDLADSAALDRRLHKLKQAALKRTLAPEDLRGATITLSVFGSIGARFATPLVTPPQVAILGAGQIYEAIVPDKKHGFRHARLLPLSLSFDHRAVTGGEALRFLRAVMHQVQE